MPDTPDNTGRDHAGRFKPGVSGNKAGPKPGYRHRATQIAEKLLAGEAKAITRRLIEAALDKADPAHPVALKLAVERLVPVARHEPSLKGVDLPGMTGARDLPLLTAAILRAALDGKVALADVPAVLKIVEVTAQSISVADHDQRLAVLERAVTERIHHAA